MVKRNFLQKKKHICAREQTKEFDISSVAAHKPNDSSWRHKIQSNTIFAKKNPGNFVHVGNFVLWPCTGSHSHVYKIFATCCWCYIFTNQTKCTYQTCMGLGAGSSVQKASHHPKPMKRQSIRNILHGSPKRHHSRCSATFNSNKR